MRMIVVFVISDCLVLALLLACSPPVVDPLAGLSLRAEDASDSPIPGIGDEWMARFNEGDVTFDEAFRETQGLGPVFIRSACAGCHADDARGPGIVTKMVVPNDAATDAVLLPFGHTERPHLGGGAVTPLVAPDDERVLVTTRVPPAVFGRGYLEAVSDEVIEEIAVTQAEGGVVSGRVNYVTCDFAANPDSLFPYCTPGSLVVGRFGLKARVPTLDGFAADAYQGDMSITSPLRPFELDNPDQLADDALDGVDIDAEKLNFTADYMRLLAIPAREVADGGEGAALFAATGCDQCHVPSLPMRADWPVEPLAGQDAPAFTDLLLHDMGEGFSDGLVDYDAQASEWRTAPLIGLRHLRSYLHDGRAQTVAAAIDAHGAEGSEASFSADLYQKLPDADQTRLITYVETL